ncbi:MAG: lipid-A-disaccharide synthase [Chitinophagaceae bacterium]|nr:lipid-A-disaccharide synthase [Chitinophagaceae bacterium]MDB5223914.1 lipid-A-disaccharide synthase [Chitinophagaceae bacterium]
MKYYIIAGEASGDLHGSNLIKEIKNLDGLADFRGWGGNKMEVAGVTLVKHYRDLAFMGFAEVIKNLPTIFKNLKFCKQDISQYQPDVVILIDYPGFNLPIAKWAKQKGLKTTFYISPQVWAWKESRVRQIKKYIDKMIVILPFEKEFYKKWNYEVEYVGHPLVKVVEDYRQQATGNGQRATDNIIALLPGSRKQEIERKLPVMLQTAMHFPEYKFIVAKAPGITNEYYDTFLAPYKNVSTVSDQTYSILNQSKAALVTSGTATLETALFEVPEVVCYKGSEISYQIAKRLIKLKFISLVNLIMNKEVVKELIQNNLTVENLKHELHELLTSEVRQQQIKSDYRDLKNLLSQGGDASANAAKIIYELINNVSELRV